MRSTVLGLVLALAVFVPKAQAQEATEGSVNTDSLAVAGRVQAYIDSVEQKEKPPRPKKQHLLFQAGSVLTKDALYVPFLDRALSPVIDTKSFSLDYQYSLSQGWRLGVGFWAWAGITGYDQHELNVGAGGVRFTSNHYFREFYELFRPFLNAGAYWLTESIDQHDQDLEASKSVLGFSLGGGANVDLSDNFSLQAGLLKMWAKAINDQSIFELYGGFTLHI